MSWLDDYHDWYPGTVPSNVVVGHGAFIETTYSLRGYRSERETGLRLGEHSAIWSPSMICVGRDGQVDIGAATCINQATIESNDLVRIGSSVFIGWGAVISDSLLSTPTSRATRREQVIAAAHAPNRQLRPPIAPQPVHLDDDVWIGFDTIVGPGVTIGRGAIVGAKSWVDSDVEPFAIVAGVPARRIGTAS